MRRLIEPVFKVIGPKCAQQCRAEDFLASKVLARQHRTSARRAIEPSHWQVEQLDLLSLHNCLDTMNTICPMRLRAGSYVGLISAIKLVDNRSAFGFRSIAIERPSEGTLAPSAEVKYVGPCECGNITLLAESGCKRARC